MSSTREHFLGNLLMEGERRNTEERREEREREREREREKQFLIANTRCFILKFKHYRDILFHLHVLS
jgi:hypothetical protein